MWCLRVLVSYNASPRGIQPILDPDADRLFNAIQVMNLGNNRTQWHNTCQRAVLDTARNAANSFCLNCGVQEQRYLGKPNVSATSDVRQKLLARFYLNRKFN